MAWQVQYRPQSISALQLDSVRAQMSQFLQTGKLPRVMLFAGPKGTGKTSTARIIAALLNSSQNAAAVKKWFLAPLGQQEPTTLSEPDLSDPQINKIIAGQSFLVQEIDAASHRRIEDVRSLQEQIFLPPPAGLMSVYILDEVHMFTTESFNALLKVLEEPPAHCLFILATTERHKIPATITSRCSVVEFHQASQAELLAAFDRVLTAEKIPANPEALQTLAAAADGSFRDGIKLLELAAVNGEITAESVAQILHGDLTSQLPSLLNLITQEKDEVGLHNFFTDLRQQGVNEQYFAKSWLSYLYDLLQTALIDHQAAVSARTAHFLLQAMNQIDWQQRQLLPFLNLELKCLDLIWRSKDKQTPVKPPASSPPSASVPTPSKKVAKPATPTVKAAPVSSALSDDRLSAKPNSTITDVASPTTSVGGTYTDNWRKIVQYLTGQSAYLGAALQLAQPGPETASTFTIELAHSFHRDLLTQGKNSGLLKTCFRELNLPDKEIRWSQIVDQTPTPSTTQAAASTAVAGGYQSLTPDNQTAVSPQAQAVLDALT